MKFWFMLLGHIREFSLQMLFFSLPKAFMRLLSTAPTSSDNTQKFALVTQTELLPRECENSSFGFCCEEARGHSMVTMATESQYCPIVIHRCNHIVNV